jgi:hypothetical protein
MEFINADLDSELVQIANETLLVEVLVQNGPSELGCGSSGCDANNAKLPGLDRRQYVENDEEQKMRRRSQLCPARYTTLHERLGFSLQWRWGK